MVFVLDPDVIMPRSQSRLQPSCSPVMLLTDLWTCLICLDASQVIKWKRTKCPECELSLAAQTHRRRPWSPGPCCQEQHHCLHLSVALYSLHPPNLSHSIWCLWSSWHLWVSVCKMIDLVTVRKGHNGRCVWACAGIRCSLLITKKYPPTRPPPQKKKKKNYSSFFFLSKHIFVFLCFSSQLKCTSYVKNYYHQGAVISCDETHNPAPGYTVVTWSLLCYSVFFFFFFSFFLTALPWWLILPVVSRLSVVRPVD